MRARNGVLPSAPKGPGAWLSPFVARLYLRRPELSELIAIKYGSPRAALLAVWNETLFRLRRESGYRLISANFEVTNACNLSCTICPVNRGMRRVTLQGAGTPSP